MQEQKKGLFQKLKQGLTKTRSGLTGLFNSRRIDESLYEELEEALILADTGVETTMDLVGRLREEIRMRKISQSEQVLPVLRELIELKMCIPPWEETFPAAFLIVGINGAGKTTSIGKLAQVYKHQGKSVMIAAGDTFRAAAVDQLSVWGDRAGVTVVRHGEGADPAAVIYDAVESAKARKVDLLLCDTAGRLHNKKNLMEELGKIGRVIERQWNGRIETLLVLDATGGQNALEQAKLFSRVVPVSGIILTKLDGTAKGGIVIAVMDQMGIPVRFVGVGEGLDDLQPFDVHDYANALLDQG